MRPWHNWHNPVLIQSIDQWIKKYSCHTNISPRQPNGHTQPSLNPVLLMRHWLLLVCWEGLWRDKWVGDNVRTSGSTGTWCIYVHNYKYYSGEEFLFLPASCHPYTRSCCMWFHPYIDTSHYIFGKYFIATHWLETLSSNCESSYACNKSD